MASSPPDFALVIHSPDKDMVTELIEKHKDKTIILACKTNNDCNYFYDNIRSFKDIIRIIRKKDCEKIKKTQQETFESEEELITITCCDCYGKSRELSEDFETQCDYILDSSNSTEYKKRFKEIQKKNKYICPYRINVKLLEKKKNPLIITTHYGLQFYTFLEEFVKDAIIIINDANSIKDVCKEEYVQP